MCAVARLNRPKIVYKWGESPHNCRSASLHCAGHSASSKKN
jgi:hypothetical protein